MRELSNNEIQLISGGESEQVKHEIAEGIMIAGIVTGNPLVFGLGVLYALTD
jgi:hypothetical protein